jgi:ParB family chromosome partitioning protein
MTENKPRVRSLGRGLSSLFEDYHATPESYTESVSSKDSEKILLIPLENIVANVNQPRRYFNEDSLKELGDSIKEKGVIAPILVKKLADGKYKIIAGERRYRACQLIGEKNIPVIIKDLDDNNTVEYSIIENVQRQDLSAIEEAISYKSLIDFYSYTQNDVAKAIGKSRSHVANLLRLLTLPQEVQDLIAKNDLTMGHARALINSENPLETAKKILAGGLSVRQAESLTSKNIAKKEKVRVEKVPTSSADKEMLENALSEQLGIKVSIEFKGPEKGIVFLHYNSFEEMDKILQLLPPKNKSE